MAELTGKAISELPAATTIGDSDLLALSQNGASKKVTPPVLLSVVESEISGLNSSIATYVRPNLLDNWYFIGGGSQLGKGIFPINQRGQTSYSTAAYIFDRWYMARGSVDLQAGGLRCTAPSNSSFRIEQYLPYGTIKDLIGKTCTFSALVNNTLCVFTTVVSENELQKSFNVDGAAFKLDINFISAWGNVHRPVQFFVEPSSVVVKAIKLEIGSTQTLAHQSGNTWVLNEIPDYGEQLARCKRYFERLSGAWTDYGSGFAVSDTVAFIFLPIAEKAKSPTVTLTGTVYIVQPGRVGSAAVPSTVIETSEMNGGKGMLRINLKGTNLITSSPAAFQIKDYQTHIDVSAE